MNLGSLITGGRDGTLVVVDRDLQQFVAVPEIAPTLQQALDSWSHAAPLLNAVSEELNAGQRADAQRLDYTALASPLRASGPGVIEVSANPDPLQQPKTGAVKRTAG